MEGYILQPSTSSNLTLTYGQNLGVIIGLAITVYTLNLTNCSCYSVQITQANNAAGTIVGYSSDIINLVSIDCSFTVTFSYTNTTGSIIGVADKQSTIYVRTITVKLTYGSTTLKPIGRSANENAITYDVDDQSKG